MYYQITIVQISFGLHDCFLGLQKVKEEGDHACIDEVSEHGADDGNDEEGLDSIVVFITDGTR